MAKFKHIKALAFDLDGTLVDSAPGLTLALDAAMQAAGFAAPGSENLKRWIGNGIDILIERALNWANTTPTHALCQQIRVDFDQHYAQTAVGGSPLYPKVKETLHILTEEGLPLALVTNKPTPFVRPLLSHLGIEHNFKLVLGGDDVVRRKPYPTPLYLVLAQTGVLASELLFIGDSRNDIQAAKAAACPVVGMSYGYNYGEPIAASHPDDVLDSFADLLPLLGLSILDSAGGSRG